MTTPVTIVEVGPRDGLQNEAVPVPTPVKVEFVQRLHAAGVRVMEVTSFVRADRIPQLADAAEVAPAALHLADLRCIALTPNLQGLEAAVQAGLHEVAVFGAASEEFSRRNINRSVAESLEMFRPVVESATARGMRVRGYVSTALGCPFQGEVPLGDVVRIVTALADLGCHEVSVADTVGVGAPGQVRRLVKALAAEVDVARLAFHGHDTFGMGLANAFAAMDAGITTIDTSAGGLGGCPFAGPGAKGNLATEDLVYALERSGVDTGIDLDALVATSWWLSGTLGHPPRSPVATVLRPAH
jgi:hydroxymethylglutaryl-CoA lyase